MIRSENTGKPRYEAAPAKAVRECSGAHQAFSEARAALTTFRSSRSGSIYGNAPLAPFRNATVFPGRSYSAFRPYRSFRGRARVVLALRIPLRLSPKNFFIELLQPIELRNPLFQR
jgi:hypothetical protein